MGISYAVVCRFLALRDLGPAISPFNAFLILNGIETVPLRMKQHSSNALEVAKFLESHSKVSWVSYAGLESNKYNELAKNIARVVLEPSSHSDLRADMMLE
jgi:O-acetylhomoserine (thiol)-lyase